MLLDDENKEEVKVDLSFDDCFPDGVFTEPYSANQRKVKVRALFEFCKKNNIAPTELTKKQMEQFLE